MSKKSRILFISNDEAGQLNATLATIHSLMQHHGSEVDVHLCSFPLAEKRCPDGVVFHQAVGKSMSARIKERPWDEIKAIVPHKPFFFGTLGSLNRFSFYANPDTPSQYLAQAKGMEEVMKDVDPDLVVIDGLQPQGFDAVNRLTLPFIVLSPNAWKDNVMNAQELRVFTWPMMGSAWKGPLGFPLIILNIILVLFLPLRLLVDSGYRAKEAARKAAGYTWPSIYFAPSGYPRLCMGIPALEPTNPGINPSWCYPIGPILLPSKPLEEADPELLDWLSTPGAVNVMFFLGSHWKLDHTEAVDLLEVMDLLMSHRQDVQVYGKIMKSSGYAFPELDVFLGRSKGRARVVEWMDVDPVSIVRSGKIALVINHGGSNSYHEALAAGIPQIALPQWMDCYDFAVRTEALGIGKWGNRMAAPAFIVPELLHCLLSVLGDEPRSETYASFETRAEECALIARTAGKTVKGHDGQPISVSVASDGGVEGRDVAAEWILRKAKSLKAEKRL